VTTSIGVTLVVMMARLKKRRAAAASRRVDMNTSMTGEVVPATLGPAEGRLGAKQRLTIGHAIVE
jgi:hypothetical protein